MVFAKLKAKLRLHKPKPSFWGSRMSLTPDALRYKIYKRRKAIENQLLSLKSIWWLKISASPWLGTKCRTNLFVWHIVIRCFIVHNILLTNVSWCKNDFCYYNLRRYWSYLRLNAITFSCRIQFSLQLLGFFQLNRFWLLLYLLEKVFRSKILMFDKHLGVGHLSWHKKNTFRST